MNKRKGNGIIILIIIILAVAVLATLGYLYYKNFIAVNAQTNQSKSNSTTTAKTSTSNGTVSLTNDQIFNQVSSQFDLARDQFNYFRIFGQDKVQYNTGGGATFAYKVSGSWKIAQENAQSVALCSDLAQVPEGYRPPCSVANSTSSQTLYVDANNQSTNYPPSSMTSYIGE
jgi:hypothetical protein